MRRACLCASAHACIPCGRVHGAGIGVLSHGRGLPRFLLRGRPLPSRPLCRSTTRSSHRVTGLHQFVLGLVLAGWLIEDVGARALSKCRVTVWSTACDWCRRASETSVCVGGADTNNRRGQQPLYTGSPLGSWSGQLAGRLQRPTERRGFSRVLPRALGCSSSSRPRLLLE